MNVATEPNIIKSAVPRRPDLIGNYNRTKAIEAKALEWCRGFGVDYGYGDSISWPGGVEYILPGAYGVDLGVIKPPTASDNRHPGINHFNLGGLSCLDFIYSSHALEHIADWHTTLHAWRNRLREGGILFLYLPHESVVEWLPENYKEHKWTPQLWYVDKLLKAMGMELLEALDGHDSEGSFYGVWRKS